MFFAVYVLPTYVNSLMLNITACLDQQEFNCLISFPIVDIDCLFELLSLILATNFVESSILCCKSMDNSVHVSGFLSIYLIKLLIICVRGGDCSSNYLCMCLCLCEFTLMYRVSCSLGVEY
ncbi:hypothetical protein CDL12_12047 [Handroanthus impetiginosus]|uniref:Uncharacterized protein n=1 Tax=Handroanthus impetiginosus TaxID=429701 RepID=A0A2G9HCR9_9LAMI|nr:hypothetical protein CDL12_12047 [Handroanthus impetiginosus]